MRAGVRASLPAAPGCSFAERIVAWHDTWGRHDLPWQNTRDPYRIWISEVMLQQTQVGTVTPYYERFVGALADVRALAAAPLDAVLALWSGLGYYRRARHLHEAANAIVREHGGAFPREVAAIAALPGIGRSTAAAIAAFAFGARNAILDGNVKRVLARYHGIEGYPGHAPVERELWKLAEGAVPERAVERYTQAMMDLGATVCLRSRPVCGRCPLAEDCRARLEGRTDTLPTPRPARVLPVRAVQMLLVDSGGEVLLEKRAQTGVWPGLWCLPELSVEDDAAAACRARYGVEVAGLEALAPIAHAFTHYRLTIHPLHVRAKRRAMQAEAQGRIWLTPADAVHAAVPAPVRQLLSAMRGGAQRLLR